MILVRRFEHVSAVSSSTQAVLKPLMRACTMLLVHTQLLRSPEDSVVVIKTRSQATFVHWLLHAALPEMKAVFLYRNAVECA